MKPVETAAVGARLVGQQLPDLAFPATTGGSMSPARTSGRTVLFLYPYSGRPGVPDPPHWDDIPGAHGSTPQAQGFAAAHPAFQAAGIAVMGLSGQSPAWQAEAAARLALPFPLLSDEPLALADALGLPTFETGNVRFLERLTLILHGGAIADVIHPIANPAGHAADLLARLTLTR